MLDIAFTGRETFHDWPSSPCGGRRCFGLVDRALSFILGRGLDDRAGLLIFSRTCFADPLHTRSSLLKRVLVASDLSELSDPLHLQSACLCMDATSIFVGEGLIIIIVAGCFSDESCLVENFRQSCPESARYSKTLTSSEFICVGILRVTLSAASLLLLRGKCNNPFNCKVSKIWLRISRSSVAFQDRNCCSRCIISS